MVLVSIDSSTFIFYLLNFGIMVMNQTINIFFPRSNYPHAVITLLVLTILTVTAVTAGGT